MRGHTEIIFPFLTRCRWRRDSGWTRARAHVWRRRTRGRANERPPRRYGDSGTGASARAPTARNAPALPPPPWHRVPAHDGHDAQTPYRRREHSTLCSSVAHPLSRAIRYAHTLPRYGVRASTSVVCPQNSCHVVCRALRIRRQTSH